MKPCTLCKRFLPLSCFYLLQKKGKPYSWCIDCTKARAKQSRLANPDKYRRRPLTAEQKAEKSRCDAAYRLKNKEQLAARKREYYLKNKARIDAKSKARYAASPDDAKRRSLQWKADNRKKHNAKCMERHAAKLQRTPTWVKQNPDYAFMIEEAYDIALLRSAATGVRHHVDHIIPLRGKTVSGLHVPWNLQILTESENCSKRNRVQ